MNKLLGRFLKDGSEILIKLNSEICKQSISHGIRPNVAQHKFIFKKNEKVAAPN